MKKIDLVDLSYNIGILNAVALEVENQRVSKELVRIAKELRQYVKQEIKEFGR